MTLLLRRVPAGMAPEWGTMVTLIINQEAGDGVGAWDAGVFSVVSRRHKGVIFDLSLSAMLTGSCGSPLHAGLALMQR